MQRHDAAARGDSTLKGGMPVESLDMSDFKEGSWSLLKIQWFVEKVKKADGETLLTAEQP